MALKQTQTELKPFILKTNNKMIEAKKSGIYEDHSS